jgi:F-type H+-transporting ATPase subunit gamma
MNLRQVKTKIKSVGNVKKITKAMQLVSAIKMKKAQAAAIEAAPYRDTLEEIIRKITARIDISQSPLLLKPTGSREKDLIIFVSSNKGLAGTFHTNLARYAFKNIKFDESEFITVGRKAGVFVSGAGGKVIADFVNLSALSDVSAIFNLALEKFLAKEYRSVSIVYNKFISTLRSEAVREIILPFQLVIASERSVYTEDKRSERGNLKNNEIASSLPVAGPLNDESEYLIEPSPEEIIDPLLRSYIEEKIRGAILNSEAVEHSSRMIAMKNATDNANDLIYNLTLLSNRIRQARITGELLDMITAKESVES